MLPKLVSQQQIAELARKVEFLETRTAAISDSLMGIHAHEMPTVDDLRILDGRTAELMGWISQDYYTSGIRQTYWSEHSVDGFFKTLMLVEEWKPSRDMAQAERFVKRMVALHPDFKLAVLYSYHDGCSGMWRFKWQGWENADYYSWEDASFAYAAVKAGIWLGEQSETDDN